MDTFGWSQGVHNTQVPPYIISISQEDHHETKKSRSPKYSHSFKQDDL